MGDKDEKINEAIQEIGQSLAHISPEEKEYLNELRKQIDDVAASQGPGFDKRLEFCYGIILSPDKIRNQTLISAAKKYLEVAEK